MLEYELIQRPEAEQHRHAAVEPIARPSPPARLHILAHGQRDDVADTATIQVARRRMVDGVGVPPIGIRHERHHPEHAPDSVIQALADEERAMAAVVLKDEEPDGKPGDRQCQQQDQSVIPVELHADSHGAPPCNEQHARCHQLEPGATIVGADKRRDQLAQPGPGIRVLRIGERVRLRLVHDGSSTTHHVTLSSQQKLRGRPHSCLYGSTHRARGMHLHKLGASPHRQRPRLRLA